LWEIIDLADKGRLDMNKLTDYEQYRWYNIYFVNNHYFSCGIIAESLEEMRSKIDKDIDACNVIYRHWYT